MSSCNGAFLICFCFIKKIIILHTNCLRHHPVCQMIFYELSLMDAVTKINPTVSLGLWPRHREKKEHSMMSTGWCWNPRRWVCSRREFDIILMNLKKERMKGGLGIWHGTHPSKFPDDERRNKSKSATV